eukprot:s2558_g3.t1
MSTAEGAVFSNFDGLAKEWDNMKVVRDRLQDYQSLVLEKPAPGESVVTQKGPVAKNHHNLRFNAEVLMPVMARMANHRDLVPDVNAIGEQDSIFQELLTAWGVDLKNWQQMKEDKKNAKGRSSESLPSPAPSSSAVSAGSAAQQSTPDSAGRAKDKDPVLAPKCTAAKAATAKPKTKVEPEAPPGIPGAQATLIALAVRKQHLQEAEGHKNITDDKPKDEKKIPEPESKEVTQENATPKEVTTEKKEQPEPDLLKALEADLASMEPEAADLRRGQLKMRANEKEKADEARELQKAKKEEGKTERKAKAKGRPRRKEGEAEPTSSGRGRRKKKDSKDADSPSNKRKRENGEEEKEEQPRPKAKAKAKRAPRARRNQVPDPDPVLVKELLDLMVAYKDKPYDKVQDKLHKIYTKGKTRVWVSVYWSRPAAGVKIMVGDKESQRFYFSFSYSSIAVHIHLCNKVAEKWVVRDADWADSEEALQLQQVLLVSADKASEEFKKVKNGD